MADPYVREVGRIEGSSVRVLVDYSTVVVHAGRLSREQQEEFAHLFVTACWEAGENAHRTREEVTQRIITGTTTGTLLDPDCRDGKHTSCMGEPCECPCHTEAGDGPGD